MHVIISTARRLDNFYESKLPISVSCITSSLPLSLSMEGSRTVSRSKGTRQIIFLATIRRIDLSRFYLSIPTSLQTDSSEFLVHDVRYLSLNVIYTLSLLICRYFSLSIFYPNFTSYVDVWYHKAHKVIIVLQRHKFGVLSVSFVSLYYPRLI